MAASLAVASKSSFIEALGDVATGRFTCGGTLHTLPKVQLTYMNKAGAWCGAIFPGLEGADFQQFLESSALEEKRQQLASGRSYHDAYALDPEKFLTSFSPADILREIQLLLAPDVLNIRIELYKMKIYTAGYCLWK